MTLRVESEIGRLRRVLVHRPGYEIDRMVPSMMERLLFDDILDGDQAREEHGGFRAVLQAAGVETLDPQELLAEVLTDDAARDELLGRLCVLPCPASPETMKPKFGNAGEVALSRHQRTSVPSGSALPRRISA
jgi:arginine deiminase